MKLELLTYSELSKENQKKINDRWESECKSERCKMGIKTTDVFDLNEYRERQINNHIFYIEGIIFEVFEKEPSNISLNLNQ